MAYSEEQLSDIYDRTSGYCHICKKKLAYSNYGELGARGAWEVEHSKPRAKGGTSSLGNLRAACITCNRSKGTDLTRTARARHGRSRAPLSRSQRKQARLENTLVGGLIGVAAGAILGGRKGAVVGGAIGAGLGYKKNPDET